MMIQINTPIEQHEVCAPKNSLVEVKDKAPIHRRMLIPEKDKGG